MWVRMESADTASKSAFGGVASSLDFASTHPANQKRIKVRSSPA
jgi:predicted Zn-dependent protease